MTDPNAITLEQAVAQRDAWLAALNALSTAQEYTITNGAAMRKLVRADIKEVTHQYNFWAAKVRNLTPGRRRVRFGLPF